MTVREERESFEARCKPIAKEIEDRTYRTEQEIKAGSRTTLKNYEKMRFYNHVKGGFD